MNKPNCYKCQYRRSLVGDAHSKCVHPANGGALDNPMAQMLAIFAGVGRTDPINADTGLNIVGNPHGIKHGWFNWPFNFDPRWLENCDGYTERE